MKRNTVQWEELKEQRLMIQCVSGLIVQGLLVSQEGVFLRLTDVTVNSRELFTSELPWIIVNTEAILACFPEGQIHAPFQANDLYHFGPLGTGIASSNATRSKW